MSFTLVCTARTRTDKRFWTVEKQAVLDCILHWIWFEYHISSSTTFRQYRTLSSATEGPGCELGCPLPHSEEIRNTLRSTDIHGIEIKLHMCSAAFQKSEFVIFTDNYNLEIKRKEQPIWKPCLPFPVSE